MSIASEMEEPLFVLCRVAAITMDMAHREQLLAAQQRFEELRLDVQRLEEQAARAQAGGTALAEAAMVPPAWLAQRGTRDGEIAGGVVDLSAFRASRAGGAVRL